MARHFATLLFLFAAPAVSALPAAEPANTWRKLDKAVLTGQRWDIPLGYAPELKHFLVLGGRTAWADYKKPRSYDELALDLAEGQWENRFPAGKDWGPRFGPCQAPAWKDEHFHFRDSEGNVRPNWTVYGTFSLGQKYDYDPDTKCFYFYAGGRTFRYDPASRRWTDLAPKTDPQKAWAASCSGVRCATTRHNKIFVLFGGGNIQSERGDPGTWTYTPADNTWTQLKLDRQPPPAGQLPAGLRPGGEEGRPLRRRPARPAALGHLDLRRGGTALGAATSRSAVRDRAPAMPCSGCRGRRRSCCWAATSTPPRWVTWRVSIGRCPWKPGPTTRPRIVGTWSSSSSAGSVAAAAGRTSSSAPRSMRTDRVVVLSGGTWTVPVRCGQARRGGHGATRRRSRARPPGAAGRTTQPGIGRACPAADPAKIAQELKDLPANRWVSQPVPKLPRPNMDWGSAVFAPELDLILRFSGGHSRLQRHGPAGLRRQEQTATRSPSPRSIRSSTSTATTRSAASGASRATPG